MEDFTLFHKCLNTKIEIFFCIGNTELVKKIQEVLRNDKLKKKFILIIKSLEQRIENTTQFNYEGDSAYGKIYAIKVDNYRFYTIQAFEGDTRKLFICRYGRKQTQSNDKKLTTIVNSIKSIKINILLS